MIESILQELNIEPKDTFANGACVLLTDGSLINLHELYEADLIHEGSIHTGTHKSFDELIATKLNETPYRGYCLEHFNAIYLQDAFYAPEYVRPYIRVNSNPTEKQISVISKWLQELPESKSVVEVNVKDKDLITFPANLINDILDYIKKED